MQGGAEGAPGGRPSEAECRAERAPGSRPGGGVGRGRVSLQAAGAKRAPQGAVQGRGRRGRVSSKPPGPRGRPREPPRPPRAGAGPGILRAALTYAGPAEWARIVAELAMIGLITRPDRAALAAYCVAYSRWVAAERKIQELGTMLMRTAVGSVAQSPYVTISNRAMEIMHKFLTEFGMTPVSRTRVSVSAPDKKKNPFALLG